MLSLLLLFANNGPVIVRLLVALRTPDLLAMLAALWAFDTSFGVLVIAVLRIVFVVVRVAELFDVHGQVGRSLLPALVHVSVDLGHSVISDTVAVTCILRLLVLM